MDRSRIGRAVAILAVAALAVAVVSPAFSAAPVTKAKVKKLAKKAVKQNIDDFGNPIFIEEAELMRFGPVTASMGDAEKTVKTFGPFTLSLRCDDDGLGDINIRVQIATTAANSILQSDSDDEDIFDPTDVDADVADNTNGAPGDPQDGFDEDDYFWVAGPGGTPKYDGTVNIATNFGGGHCWVAGYVLEVLPI